MPDHITLHGLLLPMRRKFDQYVNLRPAYLFEGVPSPLRDKAPGSIDMLVYRENTEGEYAPIGGRLYEGTPHEVAIQTNVFTRRGCERIMRAAFEAARKRPRKKVTSITKSNAQQFGMVLWDEVFKTVAKDYPDVQANSLLVDAAAMDFVRKPEAFDVVVASNLFGDILTDLSAIVTGSMGLAASANINPERTFPSMFEPVHGSAPDIAGKGIANPLAAILSAGMLLDHLRPRQGRDGGAPRRGRGAEGGQAAHAGPRRQRHDQGGRRRGAGGPGMISRLRHRFRAKPQAAHEETPHVAATNCPPLRLLRCGRSQRPGAGAAGREEGPRRRQAGPARQGQAVLEKHESFLAQAKKGGIDLLLIGDSLTDMWGGEGHDPKISRGQKVYEKELLPLKAANFGVNGDKTQNVLWRLQNGELDGIKPKVVMLLIGTNNVFDNSAEEIADGVTAIVNEIKTKLPGTRVLLHGPLPAAPNRTRSATSSRRRTPSSPSWTTAAKR